MVNKFIPVMFVNRGLTQDEIMNHILEDHKDIVIQISNDMENKEVVLEVLEAIENILAKP